MIVVVSETVVIWYESKRNRVLAYGDGRRQENVQH
jgi:hypothetical protein